MRMKLLSTSIKIASGMLVAGMSLSALAAAPVISQVTAVKAATLDNTPVYVINSDKAGSVVYGGACVSTKKTVVAGNNTITFSTLADGTYSNCTITVKAAGEFSNVLNVPSFKVDTTKPVLTMVTAIPAVTEDISPNFTINASEEGSLVYNSTQCRSLTKTLSSGDVTITLSDLYQGTYSSCSIKLKDAAGNVSTDLALATFTVSPNNTSANPNFKFGQTTYVGALSTGAAATPWWLWTIAGSVPGNAAIAMNGAGSAGYTPPATTFASVPYTAASITPAASCPSSASAYTISNIGTYDMDGKTFQVCQLSGDILINTTLNNNVVWSLSGRVNVGDGNKSLSAGVSVVHATLTVEKGTVFRSQNAASLVVTRGSKIVAVGTAAQPIIMWSNNDDDFDDKGKWGGLVLQGYAYNNLCGSPATNAYCNIAGEGAAGFFGGRNNADNSGSLKYVIIAEAGSVLSNGNELNGVGFMGVGYKTVVDYVQVHNNADDGFEFFGGAVDARHLVSTSNEDDNFDWDEGYVGNIQYGMIVQTDSVANGSHGFEMDTKGDAKQSLFQESNPTVANVTMLALLDSAEEAGAGFGMQLKEGTEGQFVNILILGDYLNPVRVDDNTVLTSYSSVDDAFINVYGHSTINDAINYNTSGYTITSAKFGAVYNSVSSKMAENDAQIPVVSPVIASREIDGTAD